MNKVFWAIFSDFGACRNKQVKLNFDPKPRGQNEVQNNKCRSREGAGKRDVGKEARGATDAKRASSSRSSSGVPVCGLTARGSVPFITAIG